MDFLVFQLYGPLASWGDLAAGEIRPTKERPSKSAIGGLLAAALGVKREEEEKHAQISQKYGVAFCVHQTGEEMRDYHTIQTAKPQKGKIYSSRYDELSAPKLETILSYRDYRADALCLAAVWAKDIAPPFSLKDIKQALRSPKFPLYLGRKSCPPALPLAPEIFSNVGLKEAFDKYPLDKAKEWTAALKPPNEESRFRYFWPQGALSAASLGMQPDMTYPRYDQLASRRRWQFSKRAECYYSEKAEHGNSAAQTDTDR